MTDATPAISHRKRFAAGLVAAAIVGAGLASWALLASRANENRMTAERSAIVALRALTQLVEKEGGAGDGVREAASRIAAANPDLKTVRVIAFDGVSLEASTAAGDTGDKAAPRKLGREEKDLFDRGQRLRAAVQTNREEGTGRKTEIELRDLAEGGLGLAGPVEINGEIAGFVDVEAAPALPAQDGWTARSLLWFVLPLALMAALWVPLRERRAAIAVVSFAAFAAAMILFARAADSALHATHEAGERAVAARIAANTAAAGAPETACWDCDLFRLERNSAAEFAKDAGLLRRLLAGAGLLGLGFVGFVGFGGAARLWRTLTKHREAYAYVTPAMIGMIVLVFFPFLYGVALSFTNSNLYNTDKSLVETWIWFKNYASILGDFSLIKTTETGWAFNFQNFYWTFFFTIVWTVTNVAIGVSVGLVLALMLNTKGLALRPIYRVLLIFPWAMPNYITALIWRGMFHQQFGVINQALLLVGLPAVSWFEKPFTSYLTALATNGWLSFPFMMVVSLGALQSIPADLYEAARVDGATRWQQFKSITLPSLKPSLVPAIILSVVWTFNMFNIIYLVTGGEPGGSTEILITQSFKIAFEKYQYGYAAAYSTVIFLILLSYGWFQNRVTKATEGV